MGACATQTFSNVSAAAWACLKSKAAAGGFPINSDSGSQSSNGVTIAWSYDSAGQTLALTCTGAPFFITCSTINGKIHELVDGTGCLQQQ
jgi:hypothetical protein